MIILGVTGPSGSGKSLLCEAFFSEGVPVLDADAVYHGWIDRQTPCTQALADAFGEEILTPTGAVDRKKLAKVVFCGGECEQERLLLLNKITHPFVLDSCHAWLQAQRTLGVRAAVLDAPLLIEADLHKECDRVIAVLAPKEIRISRIMERDAISREAAQSRIAAQKDDAFYSEHADIVFVNDKDPAAAKHLVASLMKDLPQQSEKKN